MRAGENHTEVTINVCSSPSSVLQMEEMCVLVFLDVAKFVGQVLAVTPKLTAMQLTSLLERHDNSQPH